MKFADLVLVEKNLFFVFLFLTCSPRLKGGSATTLRLCLV
jgi:hypothetical protein